MYMRMRVLPWVTRLLAIRAGSDQFQLLFVEPASRVTSAVNVQEKMEEGKILGHSLVRMKVVHQCIQECIIATLEYFVSVGQVWINFSSFGEPASRFTSAIERSGNIWKKVRY
jgi:hypothetical protein